MLPTCWRSYCERLCPLNTLISYLYWFVSDVVAQEFPCHVFFRYASPRNDQRGSSPDIG